MGRGTGSGGGGGNANNSITKRDIANTYPSLIMGPLTVPTEIQKYLTLVLSFKVKIVIDSLRLVFSDTRTSRCNVSKLYRTIEDTLNLVKISCYIDLDLYHQGQIWS